MTSRLLVGVFVGGRARRFGGAAKGLLETADGRSVLARLLEVSREAAPDSSLTLVGSDPRYEGFGLPALADAPAGIGPLGGLRALLRRAAELGLEQALALACDLPLLSPTVVQRLATTAPRALAVAPREPGGRWYALSARYAVAALPVLDAMIENDERALQRLFARLGSDAVELELAAGELELFADWDRPEDRR
jgi:molybdopterin-guanine dinucleotide biosynthesis protein A